MRACRRNRGTVQAAHRSAGGEPTHAAAWAALQASYDLRIPALLAPRSRQRFPEEENAGVLLQATVYGSILPAAWSFMLALRARGSRLPAGSFRPSRQLLP